MFWPHSYIEMIEAVNQCNEDVTDCMSELLFCLLLTDSSRQLQELREDTNVLKSTIHRLNQELSRYQIQFRKLDDSEVSRLTWRRSVDSVYQH